MKIAHESPNSIFKIVQQVTDYDYCLVHLMDENYEYCEHYKKAKADGREIILDNSIFELGEAFDADRFAYWVKELQPDWYIIPDSLENKDKTISNYLEFSVLHKDLPGKPIGVVQGKTYEELIECYTYLAGVPNIGMIAISFDYSYYEKLYPTLSKVQAWNVGRRHFLFQLSKEESFNPDIPIHLLGCSLPQEFEFYVDMKEETGMDIYSVDTSNPVVHGIKWIEYSSIGLLEKESIKLFELINENVTEQQIKIIKDNILKFREFCND